MHQCFQKTPSNRSLEEISESLRAQERQARREKERREKKRKEEEGGNGNLFDFMLDRHDRNVDLWLKGLTVGLTVAASVLAAIINERR